jgi:eukaryotic-like serine/threonine-protein kinase
MKDGFDAINAALKAGDDAALLRALQSARLTPNEASLLDHLSQRAAQLSPVVRVEVARMRRDRGENAAAERLLVTTAARSLPAELLLASELAELRGDAQGALSLVERVLAEDLAHPGLLSRRERLRVLTGAYAASAAQSESETELRPNTGSSSPYRIVREVGRGGAGSVYEAEDVALSRKIALKLYHNAKAEQAQLKNEVETTIRLEGEGVIRVYLASSEWIALEWAAQGSLREHLKSDLPDAWVYDVAKALKRIHRLGVVHNDVKPGNILFHANYRAVLTDFGIARPTAAPAPLGSAGYMSESRTHLSASDPREDVYGFGKVLAEHPTARVKYKTLTDLCLGDKRPADGAELVEALNAGK